jgi:ArsR family transcriptional regulator
MHMASFTNIVDGLRAIAEPTRLRILALLQMGEFTVKDLTTILGQSQPRVSRHVKLLADAGLITRYQEGSWVFVRAGSTAGMGGIVSTSLAALPEDDDLLAADRSRANRLKAERGLAAQAYFDANARQWDFIRALHAAEEEVEAALLQEMGDRPVNLLLDLGTGTGRMLEVFAGRVEQAIGIDASREMLKCARVRIDEKRLANCSVRLADVYHLPFADHSADAVILNQVLHFLDAPKDCLVEAARVLRPGGLLVAADFAPHNMECLRDQHAHRRLGFAKAEVAEWLAAAGVELRNYRELKAVKNAAGEKLDVAVWTGLRKEDSTAVPAWRDKQEGKLA